MPNYLVVWAMDIEADSPHDAARRALAIQRDPDGTATLFKVKEHWNAGEDFTVIDGEQED